MTWHWGSHDGGKDSNSLIWGLELKNWFSILVIKFKGKSRPVYHDHAFNSISWLLKGTLFETLWFRFGVNRYLPSLKPIMTWKHTVHQVAPVDEAWLLSFRGPWEDTWYEITDDYSKITQLTHGRKQVEKEKA